MRRHLAVIALTLSLCPGTRAQIVNRLRVDQDTFVRYAYGRMQQFNPQNLSLADSLYREGAAQNNLRYKCLALSLEIPVRFARGEEQRMTAAADEIKSLLAERKDCREFYFATLHEYAEFLVRLGNASQAMLEARAMERISSAEKRPEGRMYAYRIIGLIQSERENHVLAIKNLEKAVQYCRESHSEQELPNLYILLAQESVAIGRYTEAEAFCTRAEQYEAFFPAIRIRALMTRAVLHHSRGHYSAFWDAYDTLVKDPLYTLQTDADTRGALDITYLRSRGAFNEALRKADAIRNEHERLTLRQAVYADMGDYSGAYQELTRLMEARDSAYIRVQNEDLAVLDAEMDNAHLREQAQGLKAQNQMAILAGFLVMFTVAFISIVVQQWRLRENLEEMRAQNNAMLTARRAYQRTIETMEAENNLRIKLLQKRKFNTLQL